MRVDSSHHHHQQQLTRYKKTNSVRQCGALLLLEDKSHNVFRGDEHIKGPVLSATIRCFVHIILHIRHIVFTQYFAISTETNSRLLSHGTLGSNTSGVRRCAAISPHAGQAGVRHGARHDCLTRPRLGVTPNPIQPNPTQSNPTSFESRFCFSPAEAERGVIAHTATTARSISATKQI